MLLKSVATACLVLSSVLLQAQPEYSNRWLETARTDRENKPVKYADTMRLADITKDSLKIRKGSFLYPGTINNDLLDMGYQQYQIIKIDSTEISLGDESFIHIFSRELKNPSAVKINAELQQMALPETPVQTIDLTLLVGNWEAYNRKNKNAGKINYKTLIKSAIFSTASGKITGNINTQSGSTTPLYTIEKLEGSKIIVLTADKGTHQLTVWKLTKEELILEDEEGIIYYMKQF